MVDFGLNPDGFLAPRAADLREQAREEYEAETGLPVDWSADVFLGVITGVLSDRIGDLSEALQAVADSRDPDNATDAQLDSIAAIVGVRRIPASFSLVDLTLTGDPGTVIEEGSEVEHPNGTLWRTQKSVELDGSGEAIVEASPQTTGPVEAPASVLWEITTPVDGWDEVTSALDASVGRNRETDSELKLRRQESLQITGSSAIGAIRAAVLQVDGVQAAVGVDNDRPVEAVVAGLTLPEKSLAIVVYPDDLTSAQRDALAQTVYDRAPAGIEPVGDEEETVTGEDGFEKIVKFFYAAEILVTVAATYTGTAGLEDDIEAQIEDYFAGLGVGEPARILAILARLGGISGVDSATVTLNGSASDITPEITEILILNGTPTVTGP